MCGICGIIDFNKNIESEAQINKMMASVKHRGPDGEGYFIDKNVALGHVRLSIIDLTEQANQPMFSYDKNLSIVFNGEIYNYRELKDQLKNKYSFATNSDTEVIIYAYKEWGKECLSKLNGMFAFAIYDKINQTVFAARDRFGIKPFYYSFSNNKLLFCSEIKGVLVIKEEKPQLNENALFDFIVFNRTNHTEFTSFNNILNLRPGNWIEIDINNKSYKIEQWYFLPEPIDANTKFDSCKQVLYQKLLHSVKLHLVSDVPVGSALSGGIDSSIIVGLMREICGESKEINAFSAVYDTNWEKDETKYINEVLKEKEIKPNFVTPKASDLLKELDQLILHQEEPFSSASMFASSKVYEEAHKKGVKVLLNGQGADELFAYDYMAAFYFKELFGELKWLRLLKEIYLFNKKQASSTFTLQLFLFLIAPNFLKNKLISFNNKIVNNNFFNTHKNQSNFNKVFFSSKTLNENVKNHLLMKLQHLLRVEDKNSMRFSVEGRVPFLEHNLVEYALTIPSKFKVKKGEVKYILKHSAKAVLPEHIFKRNNKIGYETPIDNWFREEPLISEMNKLLGEKNQPMQNYLDINFVKMKWQEQLDGKNNGAIVWKYFYLTRWHKFYFN